MFPSNAVDILLFVMHSRAFHFSIVAIAQYDCQLMSCIFRAILLTSLSEVHHSKCFLRKYRYFDQIDAFEIEIDFGQRSFFSLNMKINVDSRAPESPLQIEISIVELMIGY